MMFLGMIMGHFLVTLITPQINYIIKFLAFFVNVAQQNIVIKDGNLGEAVKELTVIKCKSIM